jgi:predicted transcriptional regulator YdeE
MKVLVIVKASKSSETGEMPSQQLLTEMGQFNEQLIKAGIMLDAAGLKPSSKGVRVRFNGASRTVIDGPFSEAKELIAGFWVWKVKSLKEAIEWVKKCPNPMQEESDIEIRPFFETEEFGEAFTPELREQQASIRAMALGLNQPKFQLGGELVIAGLNQSYSEENRMGIPQQWERFASQAATIPGLKGTTFYGVCWNTKPDCGFDYLTGVEIASAENVPVSFRALKLAGSRYAVFPHTRHVSAIPQALQTIWSKWVPDCGLEISKAPCFERYTSEFNPGTGMGGMEIWVPLEA